MSFLPDSESVILSFLTFLKELHMFSLKLEDMVLLVTWFHSDFLCNVASWFRLSAEGVVFVLLVFFSLQLKLFSLSLFFFLVRENIKNLWKLTRCIPYFPWNFQSLCLSEETCFKSSFVMSVEMFVFLRSFIFQYFFDEYLVSLFLQNRTWIWRQDTCLGPMPFKCVVYSMLVFHLSLF